MGEWNPVSVENELLSIANEIARGVSIASTTYDTYLQAERAYKRAFAKAFMAHKGPQTEKKYAAELATEQEATDRDVADVAYKFARDTNAALGDKLEAMRSVGVSVRKAYEVAGRGEW